MEREHVFLEKQIMDEENRYTYANESILKSSDDLFTIFHTALYINQF